MSQDVKSDRVADAERCQHPVDLILVLFSWQRVEDYYVLGPDGFFWGRVETHKGGCEAGPRC